MIPRPGYQNNMNTNQVLYFDTGFKKTVFGADGYKDGEFAHISCEDGRTVLVNRQRLLMIEIIPDGEIAQKTWGKLYKKYSANSK